MTDTNHERYGAAPPARCYVSEVTEQDVERTAWRLLPSERVLWSGRPTPDIPRPRRWTVAPALLFALAVVFALFAALLGVAELDGVRQTASLSGMLALFGISIAIAPRYLHDTREYLVTDRRVMWKRGRFTRYVDRAGITYGRIRWHRSAPGVGNLELVRAVPFGPLARRQRITLHDVRSPDALFALIRGVPAGPNAGDNQVSLLERLDPEEEVLWGGHPEGWLLGWREVVTALGGVVVVGVGLSYGYTTAGILLGLEDVGLQVRSWTWVLFFLSVAITWVVITAVGVGLVWHGLLRARALGRETEYVLTDARLLIRRGPVELSVDRRRIVDVADTKVSGGLHHLFLVLDAPESRALADSGALRKITPARESVPPVLFELSGDVEPLKELILNRGSRPSLPPSRAAA